MKLKSIIKATWQLPQNALGAIVKKVCKAEPCTTYKDADVYYWRVAGGMSLGKYIFVPFDTDGLMWYDDNRYYRSDYAKEFIKHEYGHTIQSKYLGWFYLLVIGLPSLIWAQCFAGYRQKHNVSYYDFYTESWADKLGGVERS